MSVLIIGLVVFLGVHSVRIVAEDWRRAQIARLGEKGWKSAFTVVSLIGFVLLVWGYGLARRDPTVLWTPPPWAPHLAAPLTALAFILFPAAHVPETHFKSLLKHPMVTGVMLWSIAHLAANGTLNALVLFGAFLVWSVVDLIAALRRDAMANVVYPPGRLSKDLICVVAGLVAWAIFALWLHGVLIGVRPFG